MLSHEIIEIYRSTMGDYKVLSYAEQISAISTLLLIPIFFICLLLENKKLFSLKQFFVLGIFVGLINFYADTFAKEENKLLNEKSYFIFEKSLSTEQKEEVNRFMINCLKETGDKKSTLQIVDYYENPTQYKDKLIFNKDKTHYCLKGV